MDQPQNLMNQINMPNQEHPKRLGLAGKMASLFVKNKELNILVMLFIVAWGVGSFILMPKAYNPDIVAPAFPLFSPFLLCPTVLCISFPPSLLP